LTVTHQPSADGRNQHDVTIERLALLWAKPNEYEIATNSNGNQNFPVGSGGSDAIFPDIVAWVTRDGQRQPLWMVEVETAASMTEEESHRRWTAFAAAGTPFAIAVPAGSGHRAWTIAHGLELTVERVLEYVLDQSPIVVTELPGFTIFPREATLLPAPTDVDRMPLDVHEERRVTGLNVVGILVWLLIWLIIRIVTEPSVAFLIATLVTFLLSRASKRNARLSMERAKAAQHKHRIAASNAKALQDVEEEASRLSAKATELYNGARALSTEATEYVTAASASLTHAEQEYAANAYGPFWDAVERAARDLDAYKEKIDALRANAHDYYQALAGQRHTFPRFPVHDSVAAQGKPVVTAFGRVVRMGQTNFQFAEIFEHRRTRVVLVAGFQSLGEALDNLGATVETSAAGLRETLTSGFAEVASEIRHRS
jgi:hypothetical protein